MKRISSGSTFFMKRVFPAVWLSTIAAFLILVLSGASKAPSQAQLIPFLLVPLFLLVVGVLVFRKFVWGLADDVMDGGDVLVVRKGSVEERIRLDNVMHVNVATMVNPPRITLRLANPGKLGREIAFIPVKPFTFNPFAPIPVAEELIARVDRARRQGNTRA